MTMKRIVGICMLTACISLGMINIVMASNWTDTTWSFSVPSGYGYGSTNWRSKEDTSKVYVYNNSNSAGTIHVSIYGNNSQTGDGTDCTYNTVNGIAKVPHTISVGQSKKCSSTVRETYGGGAQAKLKIGATAGSHSGVWSPDNYAGE